MLASRGPASYPARLAALGGLLVLSGLWPAVAHAEDSDDGQDCFLVCTPDLAFEPTITVENLIAPHRVEDIATGEVSRAEREAVFEVVLALGVPIELPYTELTLETIFAPFVDDNDVEFEAELNFVFLKEEWTGGWAEAHFDVIDKFSPAERPDADSAYTHKLNLELDVALLAFNWLPADNWLRNVEIETSLDYVATGLPQQGDVIDGERFLDDASAWSLSFLLVLPIAPLAP